MQETGALMQRIDNFISELKMIMQDSGISQTKLVGILDGKCARNTVLGFFSKSDPDPRISTFLMILDACGVEMRLETERSREALMSGDIAAYREETERLRTDLAKSEESLSFFKSRYEELIDKNTALTLTVEKQQAQIEKYMQRMENAENALYAAQENISRKDARIVELSKKIGLW